MPVAMSLQKSRRDPIKEVMMGQGSIMLSAIFEGLKSNGTPWKSLKKTKSDKGLKIQLSEYLKDMREIEVTKKRHGTSYLNHYEWVKK